MPKWLDEIKARADAATEGPPHRPKSHMNANQRHRSLLGRIARAEKKLARWRERPTGIWHQMAIDIHERQLAKLRAQLAKIECPSSG